ncbi:hypothetical protein SASPL_118892 [Salvia splendens]|uniref:DNA replication licensing factor MCM7 n=1 Tax=Salvia splendens TaxID=180675 RepID=A0A8X9A0C9_SALSN|nr:hypothetical protein SASPL_118892 [Salvia splendens]
MELEGALPMDDKAKRMRDLLSSFYTPDQSIPGSPPHNAVSRFATLDTINTTSFDADQYMNLLVQKSSLEGLLQKHVEMSAEIKNLDTDLQMLVYENYNKFISATDTIKKMKNNIVGMETNMEQLLEKITSVQSRSDGVNTSLFEKREHIEKLHRTRNLLRKVQFIYDLPTRLQKCIKSEAYADAVKFYTGATPIFKAYGDSSFLDCKRASEEAVSGLVFSDSESIQARAEAVMLLKKLDFPVENLKVKLFEKLKQFLVDLDLEYKELTNVPVNVDESINQNSASTTTHEASVHEFAEAIRAYKAIFLHSEPQLCNLGQDLTLNLNIRHFEAIHQQIMKHVRSADLLAMLRIIWTDVLLMDEVLPEASLPDFALQHARVAIKDYTCSTFSRLLMNISGLYTLKKYQFTVKEEMGVEYPLRAALEASKKSVIQGSMDALMDFRLLLDENPELLLKLRDLTIGWVHEGFQDFFRKLDGYFLLLSGKKNTAFQDVNLIEETQGEKISAGLELASLSAGGGVRGLATDPAEICRIFRSSGESFLHLVSILDLNLQYIKMRTQKISVLLKKRFAAPNWVKHKEPREVHMFVDLLRQELDEIRSEVKQILPEGLTHKHRRNNSNGSTTSSRSNPLRDDRLLTRSNTQKARSQLLESHLAKLFKQKMEIFTKVEHTQESVVTTIVKLSLKSFQEFVRLQTFNRSGFQQIQLDIHFLRTTLKDITEDEAAVDFLLDEVIVSSAERCLDANPLEPPVMDRLVQAKLAKTSEQGGDEKSKMLLKREIAKDFLANFADASGEAKYFGILQDVANRKSKVVQIELEDLLNYKDLDEEFLRRVTENTRRYIGIFADAIDELLPEPTEVLPDDEDDVFMTQRVVDENDSGGASDPQKKMPPEIKRFYEVYVKASPKGRPFTIREVKASYIGQLVRISGIVTRCSDVKPLMQVAVYTCEECGFEIYQEVTARVFMPLFDCVSEQCKTNHAKGKLIPQLRASKFLKFQEAKMQELAEHVPKGHIPRSMTVHFRGELTRKDLSICAICFMGSFMTAVTQIWVPSVSDFKVSPGDVVELSGIFLPIPYVGFRAMRAGLIADTYLDAMSVTHFKKKYEDYDLRGEEEEQIARLAEDGDIYNKLSRSLAPEIFGHEDIKKALLLLLVGAPHRKLKDGMKIRGDLHICLMGDPGVAKSQLLKHIINVAPRGVYTTGKGSSGVGLTAAVMKDPVTNEMVLEGGALVLADMGICAIDEFDKMEESDRTAIHEVMEQQTVSIAKAGITTSLNARTAVLAAANPAWGRYDLRRSPAENINLPPALLSRFDLLWLILDRADMDTDLEMARHVLHVHQAKESPDLGFTPLEPSLLRAYISAARKLSPAVPRDLEEYIASAYSTIRQEEAKSNAPHTYTTIRTLLSILRISAALARLRFSDNVAQSDVDEALRLMQMSKFSLYSDDRQRSGLDAISDIYSILRDEAARANKTDVSYAHALNWISRKGYSEAQLKECLEEYAALNVWQIHPNTFDIRFIDA